MEQLKTFFSGKAIGKVLDIGTGSGDLIRLIQPVFSENTHITGIDPSDEALTEARRLNTSPNFEFLKMEGEKLGFADGSFDVVCLSNAMHHVADPSKTFSEMKRVLKPGGFLLIAEIVSDGLNEAQENQKMFHHFKSFVDQKFGITHRETWTESEVISIITSNKIHPELTFPFNRMQEPVTDTGQLEGWVVKFENHLNQIKDFPEYEEKLQLFESFKNRLSLYGFQVARQIVVVGTPC